MTDECVVNLGEDLSSIDSNLITNHKQQDAANISRQSNIKIEYTGDHNVQNYLPLVGSKVAEDPKRRNNAIEPAYRLYFKKNNTDALSIETKLECTMQFCQPAEVNAAKRFTQWVGSTSGLKRGIYNIVLGISIAKLDVNGIESISFSKTNGFSTRIGPLETLRTFPKQGAEIMRLGLHQQHYVRDTSKDSIIIDMEIRTRQSHQTHPGVIYLHYMELHAYHLNADNDPDLIIHRPYLWSINVGANEDQSDTQAATRSAVIFHYSFSGDGNYAATLSAANEQLQLDVWDLKLDQGMVGHAGRNSQSNIDLSSYGMPPAPYMPKQVGHVLLPLSKMPFYRYDSTDIMVSLSWDASKISLVALTNQFLKDSVSVFNFDKTAQYPKDKRPPSPLVEALTPYEVSRLHPKLREFCGYGKFHIIDDDNPSPRDQLFVTSCMTSVDIYSVNEQWNHLRTIADSSINNPLCVIKSVRGKYFSWLTDQGLGYICDLETGLIVNRMTLSKNASILFSRDGLRMATNAGMKYATHWNESGTAVSIADCYLGDISYFQHDSRLIVDRVVPEEAYGRGRQGAVLDGNNLSIINRISVNIPKYETQLPPSSSRGWSIVTLNGSKLDLVRLDDVIIEPYSQPRYSCDRHCFEELSALRGMDIASITAGDDQFSSSAGLRFRVEMRVAGSRLSSDRVHSIVVWVSDDGDKPREGLVVPPLELGNIRSNWLEYQVIFNPVTQQMIILCEILLMVWSLPTTLEEDFTLLATSWTQPDLYQIEDRDDWLCSKLSQCTHGQSYLTMVTIDDNYEDVVVDVMRLCYDNVFMGDPHSSLEGALALVEIFEDSGDAFKKAVLQYIGRHVNCYSNPNDLSENVVARICRNVTQKNNAKYARFLTALFESPHGRWVPRRDYSEKSNPISILLELTKKVPGAIDVAHVIINYCIRKANAEKDPHFVSILMEPLQALISRKQLHTDVSLGTLRRLAFIPVNDTEFFIDHNKIAHSPESWWCFWTNNKPPLYECENPVWQLDRRPLAKPRDPLNHNFNRGIFVASFDMLWRSPKEEPDTRAIVERIASSTRTPQSWIRSVINVILLKCKLVPGVGVVCHDFSLEFFDNPAIEALIEYKWNTIGYAYWLFRFVWECIYYLLVLSAVFIQVYSPARDSLVGVFITIIALATVFLWLEVIQARHNPGRYFSSPYNYVDLVVFVLPLVGSCLQISNIVNKQQGNTATLSFSVLLIFLHFLFELRINRRVCHFVTIVLRIIGRIRIFFFIFIAGLLAFTIAILHLLRGCAVGDCDTSQVGFPSQFYSAFSATYFFMGGIWDPVSDNFNSDDWVFHTMMITYFFFTTILLLNVLIALINVAFSTGDETWRSVWTENRLRYVESAESLTYNIPGFRDAHDWFPKEIYYSATLQEVKDYNERHFKKSDQDSDRSNALTQKIFGITSPAEKVTGTSIAKNNPYFWATSLSPSPALTRDASRSDDLQRQSDLSQQQQQQQAIWELKDELIKVQEKTDKRVEDLQTQLAEMRQMLSLLCKEE